MSKKSPDYILALDQGTTSSRAVLYDRDGETRASHSVDLPVSYPRDAWVEQDPNDIWNTQLEAARCALDGVSPQEVAAIGISNQRETTIAWDPATGEAQAPAVVWQCRRSADICAEWRAQGLAPKVEQVSGLVIDAYFSASKTAWLLENIPDLKNSVERNQTVFGTVDSWLLYQLTKDSDTPAFLTEASNACRTMLYDVAKGQWSKELAESFDIPLAAWPRVAPSFGEFAKTTTFGAAIPITGILGDQQASLLGHGCVSKDQVKCTFGTGAFLLLQTCEERRRSDHGLITSVAWSGEDTEFVVEGSIFIAGSLMQWLRDGLGILNCVEESDEIAASVRDCAGLIVVPSFVGLGAPHWDEHARGAMFGLTRDTSRAHIVRAAFEGIAHQVADVLEDANFAGVSALSIDGGMSLNKTFCSVLSDVLGIDVLVCENAELTALGAARAAVFGLGEHESLAQVCQSFRPASSQRMSRFEPSISPEARARGRVRWKDAVARVKSAG